VSKVLATICQMQGHQVKQSEVHGMAKRGGGVFSHVRFGKKVWSPTIPKGGADVLLALEWAEAMRWINHLRPGRGTFISDTQHFMPPFASRSRRRDADAAYSRETPREILDQIQDGYAMDATTMARDLGNERAANTMLLGVLSTALDFPADDWRDVISRFVPPKTVDINLKAFDQGREWARLARDNPDHAAEALQPPKPALLLGSGEHEGDFVELDINVEWCKSCDICVKMCPERCLKLDDRLKAVLVKPELCTGCRICEWLCPDLAITVHRDPAAIKASA
ncbi:MAG TPA: 2-oxoacid:acceptor oxidoreductase family protein, partial [Alphaproteobacteria bacterium]|nr:2-oxoacid:acceptor oxidoreductase family protein [Alphaproteobacteria bacterium]